MIGELEELEANNNPQPKLILISEMKREFTLLIFVLYPTIYLISISNCFSKV